ncbi:GDP-mannose transporter [Athelia psychrophila]|uniref:GDP-mannose transporter n=1 Tax=Athelia psychrophila TaxID=1759441 RepID=A0A166Q112_9AGAM|nr:GDP-mannose transporter [Fibularhizoctonia sp. CBS 109695]
MTFLLLAIQLVVCVTCVLLSKQVGLISIRPFDWQNAKAWFPISFMLVSVIYTGSKSLQFLSIPVYTIFKNLTIILIAYGEVIWFGGRVTGLTLISFLLMALSSVVAAYADVSLATSATATSPALGNALPDVSAGLGLLAGVVRELNLRKLGIGYFWMMTNCLSNAAFVLAMRKRIKVTGFSDWETMLYNNLLSIPVLVVFSLLFEDWSGANVSRSFPPETRSLLLLTIAFSGAASVGISYTTAWCIRTTSSTTYSMVGALNKLPVAASGMLFFGDVVTFNSVTAIGLGFVAGIVYAVAKSTQKREDAKMAVGAGLPMNYRGLKT